MIKGYAHVVCDILHYGHIEFLRKCKRCCDYLDVGVLSDMAVMEKKLRPTMSQSDRITVVEALRYVDHALLQIEWSPLMVCKLLKPDILFENADQDEQPAKEWMIKHGKQVVEIPYSYGISSTKIKNWIYHDLDNRKRKN